MAIQINRDAIDTAAAAIAPKVTYTGAGVTAIGGFLQAHGTWVAGLLIGLLGLCMQWYFKRRELALKEAESALRMEKIRRMATDRMPLEPFGDDD